ncbi:6-phosphogluconolactonase [Lysobacter sp. D1-1-M9]|uniref:6-phosphogluconolactonase n=1 Tax=Novilysobacter longmucuonensis TaxID=3098603 RepID=UPI002FC98D25
MDSLDPTRAVLHAFPSADAWTWASAVAIAAELRRDLQQRPRARLLLSGGGTPAPVYRALAKAPLDWNRVDVALVDERWLLPDDPDSNARLVRTHLLTQHAAQARFEPMTQPGRPIEDAVASANAHGQQVASVAVLGMGADGHTASLFPHMRNFDRALASRQAYVEVDASGCAGAQQWLRRISLTPAGLARAQSRLLLIQGERKREVLEQALASGDVTKWPVLAAIDLPAGSHDPAPLQVYWSP